MKTDKELLELAAKAAGIDIEYRRGGDSFYYDDEETGREQWNPLDNGGQALRLAVELNLSVDVSRTGIIISHDCSVLIACAVPSDKIAATRRAIVRAAAAIGERL